MPVFSGRLIEEVSGSWKWGVPDKDKKRIKDHLTTLQILKERGVKGPGIIGAYHTWRVAPLMSHALPLYLMEPRASLEGTTLVDEVLPFCKVVQRIKEAMEPMKDSVGTVLDFMYPMLWHPPMWLEPGFVEFVSFLSPCFSFQLNFQPLDANLGIAGLAGGDYSSKIAQLHCQMTQPGWQ